MYISGRTYYILFNTNRLQRLEDSLKDGSVSEETKAEKRLQHAVKETQFLRLKRSRLGVEDFVPLKVIGRGAFGEVINIYKHILYLYILYITSTNLL